MRPGSLFPQPTEATLFVPEDPVKTSEHNPQPAETTQLPVAPRLAPCALAAPKLPCEGGSTKKLDALLSIIIHYYPL